MAKKFIVSRNGGRRLMICYGDYRAEYLEDDPKSLNQCLEYLGLDQNRAVLREKLREALERFYHLETRSYAKFGKPKTFRIWRVDSKLLQIDFQGGYAELRDKAQSDASLKRCLEDMGANQFLLKCFKRELSEFLRDEKKKQANAPAR